MQFFFSLLLFFFPLLLFLFPLSLHIVSVMCGKARTLPQYNVSAQKQQPHPEAPLIPPTELPPRAANDDGIVSDTRLGMAEMVTYLPISSPFIRFAGRYVDEAFGVAAGYNFFVFEAALVPFEIVACNVIIGYWSNAVPAGGIIAIVIVLYGKAPAPSPRTGLSRD